MRSQTIVTKVYTIQSIIEKQSMYPKVFSFSLLTFEMDELSKKGQEKSITSSVIYGIFTGLENKNKLPLLCVCVNRYQLRVTL